MTKFLKYGGCVLGGAVVATGLIAFTSVGAQAALWVKTTLTPTPKG